MKIVSWNVWSENASFLQVTRFIKSQKADVICLQEVSHKLLKKLRKLSGYTLAQAIDFYYVLEKRKKTPYYLVILSKLPFITQETFFIPTVQYDSILSQLFGLEECIEGQYVDVVWKGKSVRIFNVHFQCYVRPKIRIEQFQSVVDQFHPESRNIICGDFNTYGFWHFNLVVGWVHNYSWEEFFSSEKDLLIEMLKKHKLVNIFNWQSTHPWLQTQLDFIVTQKRIKVSKSVIFPDTYGSDHQPLRVQLTF